MTPRTVDDLVFPRDQLVFVPLGGAGEIGMNMYLYGYNGKWLMVDCGITFADDSMPAVDIVLPDPAFIEERRDDLLGLIITHGHEDHLGAMTWLWPRLRCPVYATPFATALLNAKFAEFGQGGHDTPVVQTMALGERPTLGPFTVEAVSLTHSIPEPTALVLRTDAGAVLHSGDWKFDPAPLVGNTADVAALERLGAEGLMALVGDSTNVFTQGSSGSEGDVRAGLVRLFANVAGCIAVACFASNVARLESIAIAAAAHDRRVALLGRSLWRIVAVARQSGYLSGVSFYTDEDVAKLPRDQVLYVCTGSQGEPHSALTRLAMLNHPFVRLGPGDMVVFSSRIIPGNERAIHRLHNQFVRLGARVVTERDHTVHVSGHPGRAEMEEMFRLLRPRLLVPIHGEMRHLAEHATLARACGAMAIVAENGQVVSLGPDAPVLLGTVPVGRIALDGGRLVPSNSPILRSRKRMMCNGAAAVTLVVDENGRLVREPQVSVSGLLDPEQEGGEITAAVTAVKMAMDRLSQNERRQNHSLCEAARLAVRRRFRESFGKKPVTEVHLVRL